MPISSIDKEKLIFLYFHLFLDVHNKELSQIKVLKQSFFWTSFCEVFQYHQIFFP